MQLLTELRTNVQEDAQSRAAKRPTKLYVCIQVKLYTGVQILQECVAQISYECVGVQRMLKQMFLFLK